MGDRHGSSFWQFLQEQLNRTDEIGDLARYAESDPYFPRLSSRLGTLVLYVKHRERGDAVEQTVRDAYIEWQEWRKH